MLLKQVQKLYKEAKEVYIFQVFKPGWGWETLDRDNGDFLPFTKQRLKDLKFFGYEMVSLKIIHEDGWVMARASDYSLKEFGL